MITAAASLGPQGADPEKRGPLRPAPLGPAHPAPGAGPLDGANPGPAAGPYLAGAAGLARGTDRAGAAGPAGAAGLTDGLDLVVVDVETTGFQPDEATIIEIGAVRLSGSQVTGEFFSLVNPAIPVPEAITELTGITDAMVGRASAPADALAAFLAFASGCAFAAHNAPFDLGFLTAGCRAAGLPWPPAAVLDTAVLARLLLSQDQVPDCRLATLAEFFGTRTAPCHRALADAQATAEVLLGLLGMVAAARTDARGPAAEVPAPVLEPPLRLGEAPASQIGRGAA